MTKVFYLAPTKLDQKSLRRFAKGPCPNMTGEYSYHNASVVIGNGPKGDICGDIHTHADPRWPKTCSCGYTFVETDNWQLFSEQIYTRSDTGEETTIKDAPIGAVWNAWWIANRVKAPGFRLGDDGRCLIVKTPGGEWMIDARANNCTMPQDTIHKCWVRHGKPENPDTFTVNKVGFTCQAGSGSIFLPTWHGFLHNGTLTQC